MNTTPPNTGEFGQRAAPPRPIVPKSANEALRPEAGTPPPRRSRASRSQIVVFLNFIVTALMCWRDRGRHRRLFRQAAVRRARARRPPPTTVLVKPNTGVQEIADQLERRGLISDARIFRLGVRAYGNDDQL